ncbi:MAG TPA: molybdenum cofactor guanylyltransferase [Caulobacteraceae bacterium]|nr:molybdenum cofactor guanylyltransferase [Caulobacteraceae bacterium]
MPDGGPDAGAPAVAGLVLAGGGSRRFGRDKALAAFRGRPLIAWSFDALRPHVAALGLGGPAPLAAELGVEAVPDPPGAPSGPLAGILAGLAWAAQRGGTHLATAPCDTPFLPPDLVPRLAAAIGDRPVVAARTHRVHALCALWRADAAAPLAALVRDGKQLSMQALIDTLGGAYVEFEEEAAFANLNTPEDFAAAELDQPQPRR